MRVRKRQNLVKRAIKTLVFHLYYGNKSIRFENDEKLPAYNFALRKASDHSAGVSAMLRVKNEASRILSCLDSIHDIFDEIIVVNNGSTDLTADLVQSFIKHRNATHIRLFDYPITIARCGKENEETSENSVHSLAYYYNWCLSKCTRRWVFKWDGDMVLPRSRKTAVIDLLARIQRSGLRLWNIRGQTVYIDPRGQPWASLDEVNHEERCFPNSTMIYYKKEKNWERLKSPIAIPEEYPEELAFYEIKDTSENEFAHWTDTSAISPRKQIEYRNFMHVKDSSPPGDRFEQISRTDIYLTD